MPQTREALRRQILVANELHAVVGTMKGLAAVTIGQYERTLAALHDYLHTVELGLQVVLGRGYAHPPGAGDRPEVGIVVFGSELGLCGALNRVMVQATEALLREEPADVRERVVVCGARLAADLSAAHITPQRTSPAPATVGSVTSVVHDLLPLLTEWSSRGSRIVLLTPRPTHTAVRFEPTRHQLLPLDPERLERIASRRWGNPRLPVPLGEPTTVLAGLTRSLIAVDLYRAVAETGVAVHASRLAAMQAAERNIEERLEDLTRAYHQVRQARITEELLDVVSGFETVRRS